jgi:predicted RNA binding protein YcfA (HicA-like mRNA interferase family)
MKKRDLERHLRQHGCYLHRNVGRHEVWLNPANGAEAPVPRHRVLKYTTAMGICKMLGLPRPQTS